MNGHAPTITKEQIEAYKMQRVKECQVAIERLLEEYECELSAVAQITPDGRIVTSIGLKPK